MNVKMSYVTVLKTRLSYDQSLFVLVVKRAKTADVLRFPSTADSSLTADTRETKLKKVSESLKRLRSSLPQILGITSDKKESLAGDFPEHFG